MDESAELDEPAPPTRKRRWHQAFDEYCEFLPATDVVHCPECGATTLKVVGRGNPVSRSGMCDFWCATCLIGIQLFRITVPDPINIVTAAFDPRAAAVPLTATQAEAFWRRLWELRKAGATLAIRDLDRLCDWLDAPDAPARQFDPNPTVSHQGDVVVLSPELLGMRSIAYGNFVIGNVLHASIPASASFDNRPTWDNWTRAK